MHYFMIHYKMPHSRIEPIVDPLSSDNAEGFRKEGEKVELIKAVRRKFEELIVYWIKL